MREERGTAMVGHSASVITSIAAMCSRAEGRMAMMMDY